MIAALAATPQCIDECGGRWWTTPLTLLVVFAAICVLLVVSRSFSGRRKTD